MTCPKKSDEDKYVRINVTMPPELKPPNKVLPRRRANYVLVRPKGS